MRLLLTLLMLSIASPSATDWFVSDGPNELRAGAPAAFDNLSQTERSQLVLGAPIEIGEIGTDGMSEPGKDDIWIAPISFDGEPVGGMVAYLGQDSPSVEVINDPVLGSNIANLGEGERLYRDVSLDAFFILKDDMFRPASTKAGEYLAGEVSTAGLNALRNGLVQGGETVAPVEEPQGGSSTPIMITIIAIVLGLLVTGVVTWLRGSADEAPNEETERKHAKRARFYRQGGEHVDVGD